MRTLFIFGCISFWLRCLYFHRLFLFDWLFLFKMFKWYLFYRKLLRVIRFLCLYLTIPTNRGTHFMIKLIKNKQQLKTSFQKLQFLYCLNFVLKVKHLQSNFLQQYHQQRMVQFLKYIINYLPNVDLYKAPEIAPQMIFLLS